MRHVDSKNEKKVKVETQSRDCKPATDTTRLRNNFFQLLLVSSAAVLLNISGALVGKYIALKLSVLYIVLPLTLLLGIIYVGRVVFWIFIGRIYQLSYVYPVLSINYLFSFLLGILLFEERFQGKRLVGALVILMGVLVVSLSKHKYER